jgi:tetratricopeptide (TPR) repeat protein
MARAAVKAKQQAAAKAQQPSKARTRGRRRHAGGGNPNQQLFFVRLRRRQKWLFVTLAIIFALGFVGLGVGSGNGGGLQQLYNSILGGGGGSSISKAQDEIKTNPAKGYRDLATAYETNGNPNQAMTALQSYLAIKKKDAASWAELGGLELTSGSNYATQYQAAQQAAQAADPSASFLPGGTLGTAVGQNPTYANASQAAAARTSTLYQSAVTAFGSSVRDYQTASKLKPHSTVYLQELATAAQNAGNNEVAGRALLRYLKLYPNAPQAARIRKQAKALLKGTPTAGSGSTSSTGH